MFLTGASNPAVLAVCHEEQIGLMLNPGSGYRGQLDRWPAVAFDNGCFAQGERFDAEGWFAWLSALPPCRHLFAVAPDVVGDAEATWRRAAPWLPRIRSLGIPAAFVAQDELTVESCPWDAFDVLFIGGTNRFKFSPENAALIREAKRRGLHVHYGRVNSERRLKAAQVLGCDSADGTYLKFGPDTNLPKLRRWLQGVRQQPTLWEFSA